MTEEIWKLFISHYVASGKNVSEAAKAIGFSTSTMSDYVKRCEETDDWGMPASKFRGRTAPPTIKERHSIFIESLLEDRAEITLRDISLQLQDAFPEDFARPLSTSAISRFVINKLDFTLKKAQIYPVRRDSQEIRDKRREYCTKINEEQQVWYLQNCIFVDETGFNLHINRTQARTKRGTPARIKVDTSSKGRNLTVFAAMSHAGLEISACHCNRGTTRSEQFEDFINVLIRHMNQRGLNGYYVIFDNAPIHSTSAMNKLTDAGYHPLKLPPWSPFLNPIEELFSKLKHNVKKHQLRHYDELLQRIRESASLITSDDCKGWIRHSLTFFARCIREEEML